MTVCVGCGAVGAMKWDHLASITKEAGFTTPYLRQVGQASIRFEEYLSILGMGMFIFSQIQKIWLYPFSITFLKSELISVIILS